MNIPFLLPGKVVALAGRGEMIVRHHQHPDASAPTILLLHGWTASSDTNFFAAYEDLAARYSVIGVDHRGHGRGLRTEEKFSLEACADDAADVVRTLGVNKVITIGYSMGGPVSAHFWSRHKDLVEAMVFQATAMEWNATRKERTLWKFGRAFSPLVRVFVTPRVITWGVKRSVSRGHEFRKYIPWLVGEARRNDPWFVSQAGRALSAYDGEPLVGSITVPVSVVVTTKDTLVPPDKQRALAKAAAAEVFELPADHFVTFQGPREYVDVTLKAVDAVVSRCRTAQSGA